MGPNLSVSINSGSGEFFAPLLQLNHCQGEALIDVVVEFARDPGTFFFVGLN
jgi:hypothetical protein